MPCLCHIRHSIHLFVSLRFEVPVLVYMFIVVFWAVISHSLEVQDYKFTQCYNTDL